MMERENGFPQIPKGWVSAQLYDIVEPIESLNPKTIPDWQFFYLDINSINNQKQVVESPKTYLGSDAPSRARQLVKEGDILFSTVRTYLKNIARVTTRYNNQIASTGFCVIRPLEPLNKDFYFHFVQTDKFLNPLNAIQRGTSYPAVRDSDVFSQVVLIPSLPEQQRIVTKIEELFTRLDAGVEALKKIKAQLKRYRQAVLKYAFEGKLTEKWRETHRNELEPASVLLERIKAERKKQLGNKYKEPPPVDDSDLPQLPQGWAWIRFIQIASPQRNAIKRGPFGSAIKKSYFVPKGFKVYEQQNAIYDNHSLGEYYISESKFRELIQFEVRPLDFIVSCSGTIGKVSQLPEDAEPGVINQALLKITIDDTLLNSRYFIHLFRSPTCQKRVLQETRGSAMKNIASVADLKEIPIPLPSFAEQFVIADEVERHLSVTDSIEEIVDQSLKRAQGLRQSILKQAFEGKLVPQDPNDEPAEKLLERIKTEKARLEEEKKAKKVTSRKGKKKETS